MIYHCREDKMKKIMVILTIGIFLSVLTVLSGCISEDERNGIYFTRNYFDSKIDEDSDGLAEYLKVDVEIHADNSGNYILHGWISNNGKSIFNSSKINVNKGTNTASLYFNGKEISANKINGKYNLSVGLYNGYDFAKDEIEYLGNVYVTSYYNYTEFQRPDVIFTGNYSDYGVDTNNNGLYDFLTVEIEMNAIGSTTWSMFSGGLYSNNTFITSDPQPAIDYEWPSIEIEKGVSIYKFNFSGVEIHMNSIDGPYNVTCYYLPWFENITTHRYNYTDFEKPGAEIIGILSDYGIDTNGNGLFDYLTVEVEVNYTISDVYSLSGVLYGGNIIVDHNITYYLEEGLQIVKLTFAGERIYQGKMNGPYNLTLEFSDNNSFYNSKKTGVTSYYEYNQFEIPLSEYFNIYYDDFGNDTDGDGYYNYLTIELNVSSEVVNGTYNFDGYLYDPDHNFISYANGTNYITNEDKKIQLNFNSTRIWMGKNIDEIYMLSLDIFTDDYSTKVISFEQIYSTSKYDYDNFEHIENEWPNIPNKPTGPTTGEINVYYSFNTSTIDSDGDQLEYYWDWGDNSYSPHLGPFNSGDTVRLSHSWEQPGSYSIKVKAIDEHGFESDWSSELNVTIE